MDNELYQKAIQAMSIKEQREMKKALLSAIEAKNLQYQGEKGDSVVDVYQKNGDLYVVIEQLGGKQKTFNIGRVKGDKGDKGDDGLDYVLTQKDVNNIVKLVKSLVKDGKDGERGEDGYTPVKGKDYFTQADKDEIAMSVESQLAPMISEELDAETIADKLETLEGEARLDAKAIKNLPKMVQNINSGVRQLRYLSDVNPNGTTGQVLTLQADGTFALETVSGGSGVSDGDKGDITVSGSGATWTIDDGAVTFAKMQHIATNRILGRSTAGTGDIEALADGDARDIMGLATTDSPQFAGINLGHPTDTTITRVSAGVIAVEGTNVSLAGHTHTANEVTLSNISGATYTNVQQMQDIFHSSGSGTGGVITDNGNGTYAVSAGTGWIRATNDATDTLLAFNWSANASITPSDGRNYVGVEYNAGTPQVVQRASYNWNYQTDFPLGEVVKEGAVLHIFNAQHKVGDHAGKMIEAMEDTMGFARDNRTGGIILGETGTRNLTVSAGSLWYGLTEYPITAKNTSVSDTFDYYYRDGVGGWTLVSAQTAWNNTQFDNNSGTLATMSSAKFGVHWFYIDIEANGQLVGIYGQAEYNTVADANDATPPATVPDRLQSHGRIIGRLIFQKNAATATSVESVFNTIFSSSAVVNHNNLAGLQGGTTAEYYHLTSAQLSALHDAVTVSDSAEIDFTLTGQDITASLITGSIDVLKLDSGVQTSLGLADSALQASAIGSTVQAWDADLDTLAGLSSADGNFIVGSATGWVVESGATARASLGVDAAGTDNSTDVTLAGAYDYLTITGQQITLGQIDLTTDVTGDLPITEGGTGASTASAARTNLGLVIGTDVQAYDAELAALAGLTSAANKLPYFTGAGTASTTDLTVFARSLLDDANAAAARTTLGLGSAATVATDLADLNEATIEAAIDTLANLTSATSLANVGTVTTGTWEATDVGVAHGGTGASTASAARTNLGLAIGTDVQAYDADLAAIAALSSADGNFIVGSATGWVAESGATARTSLGLGSIATQESNNVSITGGSVTGITDITVADGGTGVSSLTAYAPIFGGTTATGAVQSGTVGTAGQVLTSNGAGALPTFQDAAAGGSETAIDTATNANWFTSLMPVATNAGWTLSNCSFGAGGMFQTISATGSASAITLAPANGSSTLYTAASGDIAFRAMVKTSFGGANLMAFGLVDAATTAYTSRTNTPINIRFVIDGGTIYAVNANGSANTNTNVNSGITDANWNEYAFIFNPGVDIKFYINNTLVATHTTNLPTGNVRYIAYGLDSSGDAILTSSPIVSIGI